MNPIPICVHRPYCSFAFVCSCFFLDITYPRLHTPPDSPLQSCVPVGLLFALYKQVLGFGLPFTPLATIRLCCTFELHLRFIFAETMACQFDRCLKELWEKTTILESAARRQPVPNNHFVFCPCCHPLYRFEMLRMII
jgi:hypothetical protein